MRVYRVFERKHETSAFSGEGARLYGGRWNSPGTAVIYTSSTFSLALLEIMVNGSGARIPPDMVFATVDIPNGVHLETVEVATLPPNWFDFPAPVECQQSGDAWVKRGESVGLIMPSAVAHIETNVLLNPAHPDFPRLILGEPDVMAIDRRLVAKPH